MSEIPYTKKVDPKTKAIVLILVLLLIGAAVGFVLARGSLRIAYKRNNERIPEGSRVYLETLFTLSMIIISMNITLILGLLAVYIHTFKQTRSSFLLGLIVFIGVLLIQSILSLPIFPTALLESITLFGILPNMFETIALVILFYLSME